MVPVLLGLRPRFGSRRSLIGTARYASQLEERGFRVQGFGQASKD